MFVSSADKSMVQNDKYVFDASKLTTSHMKCQGEARNALHSSSDTVLFIANKNSVIDHIKMYSAWGYPFISVVFGGGGFHSIFCGKCNCFRSREYQMYTNFRL